MPIYFDRQHKLEIDVNLLLGRVDGAACLTFDFYVDPKKKTGG